MLTTSTALFCTKFQALIVPRQALRVSSICNILSERDQCVLLSLMRPPSWMYTGICNRSVVLLWTFWHVRMCSFSVLVNVESQGKWRIAGVFSAIFGLKLGWDCSYVWRQAPALGLWIGRSDCEAQHPNEKSKSEPLCSFVICSVKVALCNLALWNLVDAPTQVGKEPLHNILIAARKMCLLFSDVFWAFTQEELLDNISTPLSVFWCAPLNYQQLRFLVILQRSACRNYKA